MKIITDGIEKYGKEWWEKVYAIHDHVHNDEELNHFKVAADIVGDKLVIDVGCGNGKASEYFKNYKGIDWSPKCIEKNIAKYGEKFICGDLEDIKDHYDYAFFDQVFEHLENPKEYVERIKRIADKVIVVLPNGYYGEKVMINDRPYFQGLGFKDIDYHYATYVKEDIRAMFPETEFLEIDQNNLFFIV